MLRTYEKRQYRFIFNTSVVPTYVHAFLVAPLFHPYGIKYDYRHALAKIPPTTQPFASPKTHHASL